MILDAASAVIQQNRNRKDKRLWTDRQGGTKIIVLPRQRRARRGRLHHAGDQAAARGRRRRSLSAVLYRTNAQSRAIEDSLMREAIPYKIIGGVRFYERKEIKDALAYLQADHQPARRREPAARDQRAGARHRQGRDGLAAGDRSRTPSSPMHHRCWPPASRRSASARSLWAKLVYVVERGEADAARRASPAHVPRPDRQPRRGRPAGHRVDRDRQDARPERLSQGPPRREHRGVPTSASRTSWSSCRPRAITSRTMPRRRSAASSIACRCCRRSDEESGSKNARVWLMTMHAAKGLEFPLVDHRRHGGRAVPALAVRAKTRTRSRRNGGSVTSG